MSTNNHECQISYSTQAHDRSKLTGMLSITFLVEFVQNCSSNLLKISSIAVGESDSIGIVLTALAASYLVCSHKTVVPRLTNE